MIASSYKKNIFIISFFLLFFLLFFFIQFSVFANTTAEELKIKIEENSNEISNLEAEIIKYQKELNSIGNKKISLENVIKELDLNRKKLNIDIKITEKKIDSTNFLIKKLNF